MFMAKEHIVKFPFALKIKQCCRCGKRLNMEKSSTKQGVTKRHTAKTVTKSCYIKTEKWEAGRHKGIDA